MRISYFVLLRRFIKWEYKTTTSKLCNVCIKHNV